MSPPKFKNKPADFDQHRLFPTNIFDLLPKSHDCLIYEDLLEHIDTSDIEKPVSSSWSHLKLIVAILIYPYSHGVFSSRGKAGQEEDNADQAGNGYTISEDLALQENRLEKIQKAKKALEEREESLNPRQQIEDKKADQL